MRLILYQLLFTILISGILTTKAQPIIGYQPVITGLANPVDLVNAGDGSGKLYIVQQNGIIYSWNGIALSPYLNVSALLTSPAGNEQGLLSMAFHPSYASNGYFFIYYTNTTGAVTLARYRRDAVNPNIADPSTGIVVLTIPKPGSPYYTNHNGGKLNFGTDGMLYFGTGDGGNGGDPFNNAQDLTSLRGKMLRIDVNGFATSPPYYAIPAGNPFIGAGGGIKEEIWAYGLRNPWRWSFDRLNADMWIGDVGQNAWEEVNFRSAGSTAGVNYGWRCYEGTQSYNLSGCFTTYTNPIFEYSHNSSTGGYSITGGYVYRGPEFAVLTGTYITADYVSGNLWQIKPNGGGGWTSTLQNGLTASVSSFGEGEDGTLYAVRRLSSNATVSKVIVTSIIPLSLLNLKAEYKNGFTAITWSTTMEYNLSRFVIQYSTDNIHFTNVGSVAAVGNNNGSNYSFMHNLTINDIAFYRLAIINLDSTQTYSEIKKVKAINDPVKILNNPVINNLLALSLKQKVNSLQVLNSTGAIVFTRDLRNEFGVTIIPLPTLAVGVYIASIQGPGGIYFERFIISR
ncbi:MAG: PQQ-dependent sugar dehydrogenase [Ferruginibacter sp.]